MMLTKEQADEALKANHNMFLFIPNLFFCKYASKTMLQTVLIVHAMNNSINPMLIACSPLTLGRWLRLPICCISPHRKGKAGIRTGLLTLFRYSSLIACPAGERL